MAEILGLDISSLRGVVPWSWLVSQGYQFVICRNYIGNNGKDAQVENYISQAQSAGLAVGVYNFIFPLPKLDPVQQAQTHFNSVNKSIYAHFIDCEWPVSTDFSKWGCTSSQIDQWMIAYFQEYQTLLGHSPILYTYPNWAATINFDASFAQYPLWIASYQSTPYIPKPWTDYSFWQNAGGTNRFPNGVAFDHDFAKDLSLFSAPVVVAPATPPPDPTPVPVVVPPPVAPAPVPAPQPPPAVSIWMTILNVFINLFKK